MARKYQFPSQRKHTLCFLGGTNLVSHVYLVSEIDMSRVVALKDNIKITRSISYISFVISAIAKVLANNMHVNACFSGGIFSKKITYFDQINAKFTFDVNHSRYRFVISSVIPQANTLSVTDIQNYIDSVKKADFQQDARFEAIRILQKLPLFLSKFVYKICMYIPKTSLNLQGSFTVTSLGHQPIDVFLPLSGGTLTFGLGQIKDRAIVYKGQIEVRKTLLLALDFDHRLIDGALAAEIMSKIKDSLENFTME